MIALPARAVALDEGWEMALAPPTSLPAPPGPSPDGQPCAATGSLAGPAELPPLLQWLPARVPGTAAQALVDAGLWDAASPARLREHDVWYRCRLQASGRQVLRFDGLATLAQVWLDDQALLRSESMFVAVERQAELRPGAMLHIRFRAIARAAVPRAGRARWRPRLASTQALRLRRSTLLGHMPGWCPDIPPVGPFRPVWRIPDAAPGTVRSCRLATTLSGDVGQLSVTLDLEEVPGTAETHAALLHVGEHRLDVTLHRGRLRAELAIPGVARWWPHTHGAPKLHPVALELGSRRHELGRVGFRSIAVARGDDGRGFGLVVNGTPVFARGACWTSARLLDLAATREACAPWLLLARDAGMNMVRIPGPTAYEGPAFHALCDELGLLVWQDAMFANFDYPEDDPDFLSSVTTELEQLLDRLAASPSLAVLCGGSEVAQQAAMLGLPAAARSHRLFDQVIPELAARLRPDVPCLPNTPTGGELPFREDAGVAHYYGVGAYLRPLEDARRAGVRFAAECLAFAQVPSAETLAEALPAIPPHHPEWKARVPRDAGAAWDFEDVRDHYLALLYRCEPARLRAEDPERYLELSRAVGADLMELAFAEWRRPASSCRGALVWQLQDLQPGAGWGLIDALGRPKAAWHGMRRVLAARQVLLSDEGLNGLDVHVLNETDRPLEAVLELACLRGGEVAVMRGERPVTVAPRGSLTLPDAALFGAFFDATHAHRFGPCVHDVSVATLRCAASGAVLSEAFHFPPCGAPGGAGRALPQRELGLQAELVACADGWEVRLACRSLAQAMHFELPGWRAETEWFHLPPGRARVVRLLPTGPAAGPAAGLGAAAPQGEVRALNAAPIRLGPAR